ncbi:DNA-binding protein [Aphanothece hegewaldii CCALA 016]|uniref:DNA-binding protein n=1 Tax=Aphanothece hegewaldii CCALA 016 TaxID=2107694 RepID=A0A2T1LRD0_9CHRO|nr:DNA-binding protein [Aphanothece hegewaldii]PSF30995.1 DNA-binding protein [Aphanothece hegewaldii CCALA 016]
MPNSLATPEPMVLRPSDFDPPLKRKEPTIPGYWTIEEIANEIGVTPRRVRYDITGRPESNIEPSLDAYRIGKSLLVADPNALEYIQKWRKRYKS